MASTSTDILDGVSTSLAVKAPCACATTANITLSGLQTIDGVTVAAGDRVLVKSQTDAVENGIWKVSTGAWSRAADFNGARDAMRGTLVLVSQGTVNAGYFFAISTAAPEIGETDIDWVDVGVGVAGDISAALAAVAAAVTEAETAETNAETAQAAAEAAQAAAEAALSDVEDTIGSILAFIPPAEHAAIAAHTSTYDCKADIETAIASLGAVGGVLWFPPGRYNVSAKITITTNAVLLKGSGRSWGSNGSVLRCTHATVGDILEFSACQASGIESFGLTCSNIPTSGYGIQLTNSATECTIDNIAMQYLYGGINVSKASETRISRVHGRYHYGLRGINYGNSASAASYALTLREATFDNPLQGTAHGTRKGAWATGTVYALNDFVTANSNIYQCTQAGTSAGAGGGPSGVGATGFGSQITDNTVRWQFYCQSGLAWFCFDSYAYSARLECCSFLNGAYGILVQDTVNGALTHPAWLLGFDVEIDHSFTAGVLANDGEGIFLTTSWIGSCLTGNGIGYGSGFLGESVIAGTRIMGNWQHGVLINGGVNTQITDCIIGANSQTGSGACHGVAVAANVNEFTLTGNKIGDLHSATEMQGYGVLVAAGTSNNYIIANNRNHNNVTGKVSDGGTGVNKSVTGNI